MWLVFLSNLAPSSSLTKTTAEFELQADGGLNTNDEARRNASLLTLGRKTQEQFPAVNKF